MTETHPTEREVNAAAAVTVCCFVALLCFLMAMCSGCASPAQKVLRSVNDYEFHSARYGAECKVPAPKCPEKAAVLREWSGALDEAGAALKRGGAFPLQLERLGTVEKGYPK